MSAASKEQVQYMLTRLLRLKSVPTPSDAADGVAAALAYCMGAHLARIGAAGASLPRATRNTLIGGRGR